MKYCCECGAAVSLRVPDGDNLPRFICNQCATIHYQNPKIVAGCLLEWQDQVLLCRRAIEPRIGHWTLPAGFMENRETTAAAAAREAYEEAEARCQDLQLYAVFNLPHISQVYMIFRGILQEGRSRPGPESQAVGLFDESDIPWADLAFPVVRECLELYFDDRRRGHYPVRMGDIFRDADQRLQIVRY